MKYLNYLKVEAIAGQTPAEYADKLSKRLYELRQLKPTIDRVDTTVCYLTYEIEERIAECIEDEFELEGIKLTCADCPHFHPDLNRFGEVKKSSFHGYCDRDEEDERGWLPHRDRRSRACAIRYEEENNGQSKEKHEDTSKDRRTRADGV